MMFPTNLIATPAARVGLDVRAHLVHGPSGAEVYLRWQPGADGPAPGYYDWLRRYLVAAQGVPADLNVEVRRRPW